MGQHKKVDQIDFSPSTLYSQARFIQMFAVAKSTIGKWHKAGLRQLPLGTNQSWYLGSEILRFFEELSGNDDSN